MSGRALVDEFGAERIAVADSNQAVVGGGDCVIVARAAAQAGPKAGTAIVVPADVPEAAAIYGAVGTAVPVDDEDQYRRLQCMTCLMGDCYERMRTSQEWLEANGVAGDVAATYVTGIFKTILTDAAGAGPETLGHLVAEQTPGGMNEMVISEQRGGASRASSTASLGRRLSGARREPRAGEQAPELRRRREGLGAAVAGPHYSPAWGAVELAAGASAWELALWRRRDDASDGAGPAFVAYAYAKRPVLRRGRRVGWDLRSPYGYSGPWSSPRATESDWAAFRAAFVALARERGYVSEFVRFSPLFPHFATAYGAAAAALATRRVATIAADLRGGADGYWRRAAKQHRNKVRKARKRGVAVAMSVVETAADVASFRDLYEETMDRRSASRFYYFDEAYYAALVAEVPRGDCYYATATAPDGSLVSRRSSSATAPRSTTTSRVARGGLRARRAQRHPRRRRALGAALGCATLHLGGASGPARFAAFKRAVGDVVLDWTLGTSVLDPGAFDALMAIRAAAVHTDVADLAARAGAFFPAYRAASTATTRAADGRVVRRVGRVMSRARVAARATGAVS
ncbi:pyrroline-5-carboxylate reductase [Aureococcus anophagefferens]|nr:pyrroline-5-carboxylate reductase [Aureococcus anophagefferens]